MKKPLFRLSKPVSKDLLIIQNQKSFTPAKHFYALAICHLLKKYEIGLDVVSAGELYTAVQAGMPAQSILLHGNNKSKEEIETVLALKEARIAIDSKQDLEAVSQLAAEKNIQAKILLRIIPGITGDTHHHIQTGHEQSKFGIPVSQLPDFLQYINQNKKSLHLLGLHAHIGSQIQDFAPYEQTIEVLANCYAEIKANFDLSLPELNVGGGVGIAYTENDQPIAISAWSAQIAKSVTEQFNKRQLSLPLLLLEPGRAIVGTAGLLFIEPVMKKPLLTILIM